MKPALPCLALLALVACADASDDPLDLPPDADPIVGTIDADVPTPTPDARPRPDATPGACETPIAPDPLADERAACTFTGGALAADTLGFRAMVDLEDGLRSTWDWVRKE